MPKILAPAMRAHLDEETTRLAAIWRITRKDGAQFFFTDHDRDIVFDGNTYRADAGFERTAIRSDAGFAVDNLDLVGVFAEGSIIEDEVRAGLFDGAEIRISFVNWDDPDGHGEIRHARRDAPHPAGLVYIIVFENLPLDEFGNRIPPITAEIAWAGAPQAVVKDTTFLPGAGYFTGSAVLDSERGYLWFKTSPDGIGRIRTSGMVEDLRVPATELGIDLTGVMIGLPS